MNYVHVLNKSKAKLPTCKTAAAAAILTLGLGLTGLSQAHFVELDGDVDVEGDAYWKDGDGKAINSSSGCVLSGKRSDDNAIAGCEGGEEEPAAEPEAEPEPVEEEKPAAPEPTTKTLNLSGGALFATNSAELTGDGEAAMMDLVSRLSGMQEITSIDVVGHTDNRGSGEYNQGLSEQRAETVAAYITAQIPGAPISSVSGMGETNPVASNQTPEGRQANRRVEVTVTGVTVEQ